MHFVPVFNEQKKERHNSVLEMGLCVAGAKWGAVRALSLTLVIDLLRKSLECDLLGYDDGFTGINTPFNSCARQLCLQRVQI